MNKIFSLTLGCVLGTATVLFSQNCKITGDSNGEGKKVYLSTVDGRLKNVDSTVVKEGKFEFNLNIETVKSYRVRMPGTWADISLCLEPDSQFEVTISNVGEKRYETAYKIINGREQRLLDSLNNEIQRKRGLLKEDDFMGKELALVEVIESAPNSFAQVVLADKVIFLEYNILKRVFEPLDNKYSYSQEYKSVNAKYLKEKGKWLVDISAPDFSIKGIDGKVYNLSDFRGKYVLLDFWASWCAPCRVKTKLILEKKGEFDKAGLELIAVSMDNKEDLWRKASEKDGITWVNLCELTGLTESNTAKEYKVANLPTLFLINPQGKIIAQNPKLEDIIELIKVK